jgi:hypothetical protein
VDLEGVTVLVLPGVCGLAVLGLLFHGSLAGINPVAAVPHWPPACSRSDGRR